MANPFDNTDDLTGCRSTGPIKSYTYTNNRSVEDDVNFYEQEIERYMQESLDSTQRSRQQLEASEQIGVATAQDLLAQREKLQNAERNLDEIDRTTQQTQRNLNSLKSVFTGFFKNKFSRKPREPEDVPSMPASESERNLSSTVDKLSSQTATAASSSGARTLNEQSRNAIKGTRWEAMDNEIDENLDAMTANLARLKNLGNALGEEVEDQNRMLDRIQVKADKNDITVRHQDNQMKRLLGYKGVPDKAEDTAGLQRKK
uniref:t-SNARE coiled-coil homology domain-containing protein n=1 Tax=Steinernema glaseri TaxID=37863 RepID=A0A1I8ASB5_9BILA